MAAKFYLNATSSTTQLCPDVRGNARHAILTGSIRKRSALKVMLRRGTYVDDSHVRCSVFIDVGMTTLTGKPAEQTVTLCEGHLCT